MDDETFERLYQQSLRDFPEYQESYNLRNPPSQRVIDAEDLPRQMDLIVNEYIRAIRRIGGDGKSFAIHDELFAFVYERFNDDFNHPFALVAGITKTQPRHLEKALGLIHKPSYPAMEGLVAWFAQWALFTRDLPIQRSVLKKEIVAREHIVDERMFSRYLNFLCDAGILEKVKRVRAGKNTRGPKSQANVYYKVNSRFFKHSTEPDRLIEQMPNLFRMMAQLTFEKNLAIGCLVENNLYSEFDRKKREFSAGVES